MFKKNAFNIWHDPSDVEHVLFTTGVFAICFLLGQSLNLGLLTALLSISGQGASGIEMKGLYFERLKVTLLFVLFSVLIAALAVFAKTNFTIAIGSIILLAFCFGIWRQFFPGNWPGIVIPSGVIFFIGYFAPYKLELVISTAAGALIGFAAVFLLGVYIIYTRKSNNIKTAEAVSEKILDVQQTKIAGMHKEHFLYAVELTILLVAAVILCKHISYPHSYWIPLTIIILFRVGQQGTIQRFTERLVGTIGGCIAGSALMYFHPSGIVRSIMIISFLFLFLYYIKKNYAIGSALVTIYVMLLLGASSENLVSLILERIGFTFIAGTMTIMTHYIFLPFQKSKVTV